MLGLGLGEILFIGVVLLVVVGPDRLPKVVRTLGRTYGRVRRASDELRRAFILEADRIEAEEATQARAQRPPEEPPEGFTAEEWATVPERVKELSRRARGEEEE